MASNRRRIAPVASVDVDSRYAVEKAGQGAPAVVTERASIQARPDAGWLQTQKALGDFAATDRETIRELLGEALTDALARHTGDVAPAQRATWLLLFREAAALSSDERLAAAAVDLSDSLRRDWPSRASVADAMYAVDACLRAADVDGDRAGPLIAAAIDELERIVGESYEPG